MAKIQVGDVVYVKRECMNWNKYQIKMLVKEVTTWPVLPKGRAKAYVGVMIGDNGYVNTWHSDYLSGRKVPVVRRTPWPGLPVVTTVEEWNNMTNANLLPMCKE